MSKRPKDTTDPTTTTADAVDGGSIDGASAASSRRDDALVPMLNRGDPVKLSSDPAVEGPVRSIVIPRGVAYVQRADLFAVGSVVRLADRSNPDKPVAYEVWRRWPECPAAKSGQIEVCDLREQPVRTLAQAIAVSTDAAALEVLRGSDARDPVRRAVEERLAAITKMARGRVSR